LSQCADTVGAGRAVMVCVDTVLQIRRKCVRRLLASHLCVLVDSVCWKLCVMVGWGEGLQCSRCIGSAKDRELLVVFG
jgi:hypothetical protein